MITKHLKYYCSNCQDELDEDGLNICEICEKEFCPDCDPELTECNTCGEYFCHLCQGEKKDKCIECEETGE